MMFWMTLFHESWIRKQNQIANVWLVRDLDDVTTECEDFEHEETIDPDTLHKMKEATKNAYKYQLIFALPISLVFVCGVICTSFMVLYIELMIVED